MKQIKPKYIEVLSKYTMPFTYLILSIVGLALCTSCVSDKLPSPAIQAEEVDIDLSVQVGLKGLEDPNATEAERRIGAIRIYAFDANGYLDKMERKTPDVPNSYFPLDQNTLKMEMTVLSGMKKFVVIANEPNNPTWKHKLDAITSIFMLRKTLYDQSDFEFNKTTDPDKYGHKLPFVSESELVEVVRPEDKTSNANQIIPVPTGRAVAKLKLDLEKHPDNEYEVKIASISIVRTPKQSYILPDNTTQKQIDADGEISIIEGQSIELLANTTTNPTANTFSIEPRYVWEYTPKDKNKDKATAFKIGFQIKDSQSNVAQSYIAYIPIFYRDTKASSTQTYYSIKRNTYYYLKAKVKNSSLEIKYEVLDWDDEEQYDKIPGEDDSGINVDDWDEEDPDKDTPDEEKDFTFEVELQ